MRIISDEEYYIIEKALYSYLNNKALPAQLVDAVDLAIVQFEGEVHEQLIKQFYFNAHKLNKDERGELFRQVCGQVYVHEQSGYTLRREIIYRVAMNLFSNGFFVATKKIKRGG